MEIRLIGSTNNFNDVVGMTRFGQSCARVCYSEKDFDELEKEPRNEALLKRVLDGGHHSVFGHTNLNFYISGAPKALIMVLNNEKDYTTSEKSARYTQMREVVQEQRELYDKWMERLTSLINKQYPQMDNTKVRDGNIKKLCQENARYMTSVFTPTKMVYSVDLRQINFLIHEFERFIVKNGVTGNDLKNRLALSMKGFLAQEDVQKLRVGDLDNQTERDLSFFRDKEVEKHFGDTYSLPYQMTFAGLAQAHRHRTLSYEVSYGYQLGAPLGFFIPEIIRGDSGLSAEWLRDLEGVAKNDFPQAQLLEVNERGNLEDFRSKCILRLCGHAQHEIMRNTLETAREYAQCVPKVASWVKPKCMQGMKCVGSCVWSGKRALERIV